MRFSIVCSPSDAGASRARADCVNDFATATIVNGMPPNLLAHYLYLGETTLVQQAIETARTSVSTGGHSSSYWCQQRHHISSGGADQARAHGRLAPSWKVHSNTRLARSEGTLSCPRRRECCRSPYHRGVLNWVKAGRASRLARSDFISSPRSAGMDRAHHLRREAAQVSGEHLQGRKA